MNYIYFSEYSIGRFPVILLSMIVIVFLIFRGSKSIAAKWLLLNFVSFFLFNFGYFVAYSVYSPWGSLGWYIVAFGSFAPVAFIQFAYRFPVYHFKKESRIVLFISSLLFLISVIDYFILALKSPVLATVSHYGSTYTSRFLPIYWVSANIWTVVLFLRQSAKIGIEYASAEKQNFNFYLIFFPKEKQARAARNFALLAMVELSLSVTTTLFMNLNVISFTTYNMLSSGDMLIICFVYIVVYINNTPEENTFMIKLTGLSLVTIFLVIGGMSTIVMSNYDTAYTEIRTAQRCYIIDHIDNDGAELPAEVRFIIASNNRNNMDNPEIKFSRDSGFKIQEPLRFWERHPSIRNLLKKETKGSDLLDYHGVIRNIRFFTQINNQNYFYFSYIKNNILYGVGYDFIQYRKYMHDKACTLLLIILGVFLLVLVFYPIIFYIALVHPLNNLLSGVRKVDRGDLDVNVPIQFNDEIGYISELFNKMVLSIKEKNKNLDDYATNLGLMVVERTSELEKERRLLSEKNKIIENDIFLAKTIQQGLIPKSSPVTFISSFYKPMTQVGGDFYDFVKFRDPNQIGIFISDVSGHGVPAAFITSMLKTTILQSGNRKEDPAELMSYINEVLLDQTAGNFITAFYGIYDSGKKSLRYANAGHPLPYIITDEIITQLPRAKSTALAIFTNSFLEEKNKSYRNFEVILHSDSKLFLYTDGLSEACSAIDNTFFEQKIMLEVFAENKNLSSQSFIENLFKALISFRGTDSFEDDVCLICLDVE